MDIIHLKPPAKTSHEEDLLREASDLHVTTVGPETDKGRVDVHLPVWRMPLFGSPERWSAALAWYRGLERLQDHPSDAITSVELYSLSSFQAADLAQDRDEPLIPIIAEILPSNPLNHVPPWRAFRKRVVRAAAGFICMTETSRRYVIEMGADPDRVHTVSPGLDVDEFAPASTRATDSTVVFVGELRPDKGVLKVIGACESVRRQEPSLRLCVVGAGPLDAKVRALAETRPWLDVRGRIPRSEIPSLLRSARSFCIAPSTRTFWAEQFGYAAVEAMACGLPVVATLCGAVAEVVPEENYLVEEGDTGALTASILQSLQTSATTIGERNRSYVLEHYDIRRQSDKVKDLLGSIAR